MTVTTRTHVALAVTLLFVGASALTAQSLADAARKEEQRRQGVKTPGKSLTNKDLKPVPPSSAEAVPPAQVDAAVTSPPGTSDARPDAGKGDDKPAQASGETKRDQKYWSGRMKGLQEQVRRDNVLAEAMQSRINALTTDFVNRDDPAQRNVIAKDRQTSVDELARLKKAVADGTKAMSDLEDEARRSGVPAGWLR